MDERPGMDPRTLASLTLVALIVVGVAAALIWAL